MNFAAFSPLCSSTPSWPGSSIVAVVRTLQHFRDQVVFESCHQIGRGARLTRVRANSFIKRVSSGHIPSMSTFINAGARRCRARFSLRRRRHTSHDSTPLVGLLAIERYNTRDVYTHTSHTQILKVVRASSYPSFAGRAISAPFSASVTDIV